MSNQTTVTKFLLLGFSEVRELQILHSVVFLGIYLAALVGNVLVIILVVLDHHLPTPVYFFLMNLSLLDFGSISITVPKSMANSLLNTRSISYSACITQVFLFIFSAVVDIAFLIIMAYDRYIAVCQSLHYETIMNRGACVQKVVSACISGIPISTMQTDNIFALPFGAGNKVDQFFCEIPQLLKITCNDTYLCEVVITSFLLFLGLSCFAFIIVSYVQIFKTVLRIPSEQGQNKAFSTFLPHLTVVSLLVCTATFAYVKPPSSSASGLDVIVALYSVRPPVMNPAIYSMRNKEIKGALRKLTEGKLSKQNNISRFLP